MFTIPIFSNFMYHINVVSEILKKFDKIPRKNGIICWEITGLAVYLEAAISPANTYITPLSMAAAGNKPLSEQALSPQSSSS